MCDLCLAGLPRLVKQFFSSFIYIFSFNRENIGIEFALQNRTPATAILSLKHAICIQHTQSVLLFPSLVIFTSLYIYKTGAFDNYNCVTRALQHAFSIAQLAPTAQIHRDYNILPPRGVYSVLLNRLAYTPHCSLM